MPFFYSVYLDLCRSLAASTVFLGHIPMSSSLTATLNWINTGYDAVIIFFVLSGYVISLAAAEAEKDWFSYMTARVARIMPVALCALCISLVLQAIAAPLYPEPYERYAAQMHKIIPVFLVHGLFLNQAWWLDIKPFGDGPYWSLPFEVWDYVFYGALLFLKGRIRLLTCFAIVALLGPKFLLLLPVWLIGSLAYHWRDRVKLRQPLAWACALAPILICVPIKYFLPSTWSYQLVGQHVEHLLHHGLDGAAAFVWAYILAILFATHLWAVRQINGLSFLESKWLSSPIKGFAGISFSLYLFHMPIANFFLAHMPEQYRQPTLEGRFLIIGGTLCVVYTLAALVEKRRSVVRAYLRTKLAFLKEIRFCTFRVKA